VQGIEEVLHRRGALHDAEQPVGGSLIAGQGRQYGVQVGRRKTL
jgi:hypothetical protein